MIAASIELEEIFFFYLGGSGGGVPNPIYRYPKWPEHVTALLLKQRALFH